jgi:MFS family permease
MGRRGANQLAVCIAALGTLSCGLSMNMEMLIAARFVHSSIDLISLFFDISCSYLAWEEVVFLRHLRETQYQLNHSVHAKLLT